MRSRDLHCTETRLKTFIEVPTDLEFLEHINGRRDHDLELAASGEDADPDCPMCGWGAVGCAHDDSGCRKTGRTTDQSVWLATATDMGAETHTIADAEYDQVLGVWTAPLAPASRDEEGATAWVMARLEPKNWGRRTGRHISSEEDAAHTARREALEMMYRNLHGHPALKKEQKYAESVFKRTDPNATARYGMSQFERGKGHKEAWRKASRRADNFIRKALQRYCDELEVASIAGLLPAEYAIYLRFGQEALNQTEIEA